MSYIKNLETAKRIAHKIVELDNSKTFENEFKQLKETMAKSKDWAEKFCREFEKHENQIAVLYYIPDLDAYSIAWFK